MSDASKISDGVVIKKTTDVGAIVQLRVYL
jgi:hypothetical protein